MAASGGGTRVACRLRQCVEREARRMGLKETSPNSMFEVFGARMARTRPGPAAWRAGDNPSRWQELLGDCFAARVASEGYRFRLNKRPRQWRRPPSIPMDEESRAAARVQVTRLLNDGAIEIAPASDQDLVGDHIREYPFRPNQPWELREWRGFKPRGRAHHDFEHQVFTVDKRDSAEKRLCTNFRPFNLEYVDHVHFKMEGLTMLKDMIEPRDFIVKADLEDAFLTVPLARHHKKFCRFTFEGKRYQWRVLMFGAAHAPLVFTKLLRPVMHLLRKMGCRCIMFMDDLIMLGRSKVEAAQHLALALRLIGGFLGLKWKAKKLEAVPLQRQDVLGVTVDTNTMEFSLPPKKRVALRRQARRLLARSRRGEKVRVRDLARLVGQVEAARACVPHCLVGKAPLLNALRRIQESRGWNGEAVLPMWVMPALERWADLTSEEATKSFLPVATPAAVIEFAADAAGSSDLGWGAWIHLEFQGTVYDFETRGSFDEIEAKTIINDKETYCQDLGLRALLPLIPQDITQQCHLLSWSDNTTAVSRFSKRRARVVSIQKRICDLDAFLRARIHPACGAWRSRHLPGVKMTRADTLSRFHFDTRDWKMNREIFAALAQRWGGFDVDLFAAAPNAQVPVFAAIRPDPRSAFTDAFSRSWANLGHVWAFPPFALIARVVAKMAREQCSGVLIAPAWAAHWLPQLARASVEAVVLPMSPQLLRPPNFPANQSPYHQKWPLIAWHISHDAAGLRPRLSKQSWRRKVVAEASTLRSGLPSCDGTLCTRAVSLVTAAFTSALC